MDNAACHPREIELENIKVMFLPPATTALSQPLDQGIIKNFKTWYRLLVLKHVISKLDDITDIVKAVDLL